MLNIERLSLQLPAGYESRSDEVLKHLAAELAGLDLPMPDTRLARLQVPPIRMESSWSSRELARHIARAIHHSVQSSAANRASTYQEGPRR